MDQKNNNQGGFGNGFVLGLLIGVVATLLITTKRGREIFKEITEKGIDKFSDLEDKLQEKTQDLRDAYDEVEEEDDYVPQESREVQPVQKPEPRYIAHEPARNRPSEAMAGGAKHHESSHKQSGVRRFFKKKS